MSDNIFSLCFYLASKRALSILTACHFNGRAFQQANLYSTYISSILSCIFVLKLFLFIQYGAMDRVDTYIARQIWPGISELSDDNVVPLRRRAVLASPISCFHS